MALMEWLHLQTVDSPRPFQRRLYDVVRRKLWNWVPKRQWQVTLSYSGIVRRVEVGFREHGLPIARHFVQEQALVLALLMFGKIVRATRIACACKRCKMCVAWLPCKLTTAGLVVKQLRAIFHHWVPVSSGKLVLSTRPHNLSSSATTNRLPTTLPAAMPTMPAAKLVGAKTNRTWQIRTLQNRTLHTKLRVVFFLAILPSRKFLVFRLATCGNWKWIMFPKAVRLTVMVLAATLIMILSRWTGSRSVVIRSRIVMVFGIRKTPSTVPVTHWFWLWRHSRRKRLDVKITKTTKITVLKTQTNVKTQALWLVWMRPAE